MKDREDLSVDELIEALREEIRILRYALARARADIEELRCNDEN